MTIIDNLNGERARRILRFIVARKCGPEANPTVLGNVQFWLGQKQNPGSGLCYDTPVSQWDSTAIQKDVDAIAAQIWEVLKTYVESFDPSKFPVYIINGRASTAWAKGKRTGFKQSPWLAGTFDTKAEADAFKRGVAAGIGGGLTYAVFLGREDAALIDGQAWEVRKAENPHA